jgi:B12-binding domain/radical SAM domain protein
MGTNGERPKLIFRKTRGNRHTLPRLLGILEGEGLSGEFDVRLEDSVSKITPRGKGERAVLCFSFMTPHLLDVKREAERLRQAWGDGALIIAGGAHPTGDPQGALKLGFDRVFSGEADETFPDFLRAYLSGRLPEAGVIAAPEKNCPIGTHPPFSFEKRFFAPVELTRGCLSDCHFCQTPRIFGRRPRHRGIADLSGFLKQAVPMGFRQITFISPNAFAYGADSPRQPNPAAIEELLAGCRDTDAPGLHFGCYPSEVRPDWVFPEVLRLVRKYCHNQTIVLGAQSGSDSVLSAVHRGHTANQAMAAARMIYEAGFRPHVDFVFGFPEETVPDRRLSLSMIRKMIDEFEARVHVHTFMPLPGTPLFRKRPTELDPETRNALLEWEKRGVLDGWWKDQEAIGRQIVKWREEGMING